MYSSSIFQQRWKLIIIPFRCMNPKMHFYYPLIRLSKNYVVLEHWVIILPRKPCVSILQQIYYFFFHLPKHLYSKGQSSNEVNPLQRLTPCIGTLILI